MLCARCSMPPPLRAQGLAASQEMGTRGDDDSSSLAAGSMKLENETARSSAGARTGGEMTKWNFDDGLSELHGCTAGMGDTASMASRTQSATTVDKETFATCYLRKLLGAAQHRWSTTPPGVSSGMSFLAERCFDCEDVERVQRVVRSVPTESEHALRLEHDMLDKGVCGCAGWTCGCEGQV